MHSKAETEAEVPEGARPTLHETMELYTFEPSKSGSCSAPCCDGLRSVLQQLPAVSPMLSTPESHQKEDACNYPMPGQAYDI